MTLPLVDTYKVRPVKGPAYTVGPRCANPNCNEWADDAHHLYRRSNGFGAQDWIEIDGWIVANKTGLCQKCHLDLTGPIPADAVIHHACLNRRCFNPEHLELTTREEHPRIHSTPECVACGADDWYYRPNGWRRCRPCHARRERLRGRR